MQNPSTPDLTIHQWFEAQVVKNPTQVALVSGATQLTYAELNQRANQVAHYLMNLGVQPEEIVAVAMGRSLNLFVAFLGILKASAAYLPLDLTYPHERRAYKLRDASVGVIVTEGDQAQELPAHQAKVVRLDRDWAVIQRQSTENPICRTTSQGLAYVLYTSGSTGNPKGVMIEHCGVVNHAAAIAGIFGIQAGDRMLQFSNIGFDIIIEELYPTLVSGATLVIRPEVISSSTQAFWQFVEAQQITLLDLPTAFWHELVNSLAARQQVIPPSLRLVCVGGEKASRTAYAQWRSAVGEQVRWINTYGPTETTVTATWYDPLQAGYDAVQGEIPIGQPLPQVETYVLDAQQQPVPVGTAGELYIGGPGVARGYLNLPDKTADRFVPHPWRHDPNARLYRTGDMVRWRADETLEFIGRVDFQVKVRGFRIELGEIEAQMEQHPDVRQAVVVAHERSLGNSTTKSLVAYVVLNVGAELPPKHLGHWLQQHLPDYMVPQQFIYLASLPLTPNGKVDRQALPEPALSSRDTSANFELPRSALESTLLDLWEQVLGVPLTVQDNFFEMGGHSLLVARLCDRIEQQLNRRISPVVLFQSPTVRQLADDLQQERQEADHSSAVVIQPGSEQRSPLFAIHVLGEGGRFFRPLAQHLGVEQPVYGLAAQMLDNEDAPENRVEALASYYIQEIQRIQPEGPYYLVGMSYGGAIAYEMARQMQQRGLPVGMVGLLDTYGPNLETILHQDRLQAHWQAFQAQGVAYLWDKFRNLRKERWERWQVAYARFAQARGWRVSYELRYKIILDDNTNASNAFQPQPYEGRLSLFRAIDGVYYSQEYLEQGLGWRDLVGQLNIYDVSGDHMTMVEEPHAQMLAQQVKRAMQWEAPLRPQSFVY
jgi:aspartate racemase